MYFKMNEKLLPTFNFGFFPTNVNFKGNISRFPLNVSTSHFAEIFLVVESIEPGLLQVQMLQG